jgi:FMN reductase
MPEASVEPSLNVVGVSGSLHAPSKSTALVRAIIESFAAELTIDARVLEVSELAPGFAGALRRSELSASAREGLQLIEGADLLVVASPVYRASYTGLFKHLFDFVDQDALVDTPVFLAATGGNELHSLVIEHQFRPLFGFFRAASLPTGVYAKDSDFTDYVVSSASLRESIDRAVLRAVPFVRGRYSEVDAAAES